MYICIGMWPLWQALLVPCSGRTPTPFKSLEPPTLTPDKAKFNIKPRTPNPRLVGRL